MKVLLVAVLMVTIGCASQLDLREGDISITLVEIDAEASTPLFGSVEADGCMLVMRGVDLTTTPIDEIKMATPTCSFGTTEN